MTELLRPARAEDAPACAAILSDWVAETPWFPKRHSRAEDLEFVTGKLAQGETTVAQAAPQAAGAAPRVAGFMVLEDAYVACLYLPAWARGRGIGKRLLDRAKAVRPRGFTLWTFQANTGARRFYAREGLVALRFTDGAENEERLPDVEFAWRPSAAKETEAP